MKRVEIYTDGACSGNPGPGAYAAILIHENVEKEMVGGELLTTNNQMELMAVIKGLEALTGPCSVTVYSDSAYVVNAFLKNWLVAWKNNNWKNSNKEPVKNIELWKKLDELVSKHKVEFVKVKGHSDNELNNRCDRLAVNHISEITKIKNLNELDEENQRLKEVFKDKPVLETKRLILRPFEQKDINDLYEYASDAEVTKYLTFKTYKSIEEAEKRIEFLLKNNEQLNEPIKWAIELKENSKVIGSIDYVKWIQKDNMAEIGYVLNRNYWSNGYMTEAVKKVIQFGFEKMELNRIEITCDSRNNASERVMQKNNLVYEGTRRQCYLNPNKEYIDEKIYSILKEEYIN